MKRSAKEIEKRIKNNSPVYSATFIFRLKNVDSEFERFNTLIDQAAASNEGFLGKEEWANPEENKRSVIYYWNSLKSLRTFSNHPDHQKAKQQYKKWYSGFEVIISEIVTFRSDDGL